MHVKEEYATPIDCTQKAFLQTYTSQILAAVTATIAGKAIASIPERRPGIPCMCMREIIESNFIIQIVKNRQSYKNEEYV